MRSPPKSSSQISSAIVLIVAAGLTLGLAVAPWFVYQEEQASAPGMLATAPLSFPSTDTVQGASLTSTPIEDSSPARSTLLPEHESLLEPGEADLDRPTPRELHDMFEDESADPDWAYAMGDRIRAILMQHAPSPSFDIVFCECRETLCEIRAFGYSDDAPKQWNRAMVELQKLPISKLTQMVGESDGRSGFVTLLSRAG